MTAKRIMLLGANGQVGLALRAETLPEGWQLGAYGHAECDLANHGQVQKTLQTFKPDVVINAAAMTNVDLCEKEQERAVAVNFEGAANLAAQCSVLDVPLIHISTDYVFDGQSKRPYKTDDQMNPLNIYGNTKMMGEESVRHEMAYHVILRISSVFSAFGGNMLTRALKSIDERDEIKAVTDQKSCPTYAPDAAKAMLTIAASILRGNTSGFGTFHLCGAPEVTRIDFMRTIMELYAPYTKKRPKIVPALSADFPDIARRPAYAVLDCEKIARIYSIQQRPWREGLSEAIQVLTSKNRAA